MKRSIHKVSLALLLAIILIILHLNFQFYRATIEFSAAVIGAVMALVGVLFVYESIRESQKQAQRRRSMEIIDQLNQYEGIKRRELLKENVESIVEAESDLVDFLIKDKESYYTVYQLLGIFEDIALMIRWNIVDEWILFDSIGYMVPFYYDMLHPFIEHKREECEESTIYERIEYLVDRWKKNKSARTSKPLMEPPK